MKRTSKRKRVLSFSCRRYWCQLCRIMAAECFCWVSFFPLLFIPATYRLAASRENEADIVLAAQLIAQANKG